MVKQVQSSSQRQKAKNETKVDKEAQLTKTKLVLKKSNNELVCKKL